MIRIQNQRLIQRSCVLLIAVLHGLVAMWSSFDSSPTIEEPLHIIGGLSYWSCGDYRINPEGGVLSQKLLALPVVLFSDNRVDKNAEEWIANRPYALAEKSLFQDERQSRWILFLSRSIAAIASCCVVLVVYGLTRDIFGTQAAICTMVLAASLPSLLAFAGVATPDIVATFFITLTMWMGSRSLDKLNVATICGALIGIVGAVLSSYLSLVVVVVLAVLYAIAVMRSRRIKWIVFGSIQSVRNAKQKLVFLVSVYGLTALVVYASLWASFGWRFSAISESSGGDVASLSPLTQLPKESTLLRQITSSCVDWYIVPEAYLLGFVKWARFQDEPTVLFGESKGWRFSDLPILLLVKTPVASLALWFLAIAGTFLLAIPRRNPNLREIAVLRRLAFPLASVFLLFGAGVFTLCKDGIRDALPFMPILCVISGVLFCDLLSRSWVRRGSQILLMCSVVSAVVSLPNCLAYFNWTVPQASQWKVVAGSSYDWGQDLYRLGHLLQSDSSFQPDERVFLDYFGPFELKKGIPNGRAEPVGDLVPGVYCVSTSRLLGYYDGGPWSETLESSYQNGLKVLMVAQGIREDQEIAKQLANDSSGQFRRKIDQIMKKLSRKRLMAFLSEKKPIAVAGRSIFVFRLTASDLSDAAFGKVRVAD